MLAITDQAKDALKDYVKQENLADCVLRVVMVGFG
jgi:Fe-S cluster assembly iron-binding protein IscA